MNIVKIFYDTETTGDNPNKHSLHQVAGLVEVNDEVVERFDIRSRPHPKAILDPTALSVCQVTPEELMAYPSMEEAQKEFCKLVGKYVDRYDRRQKAYLVGYNNREFDDRFLRMWFNLCGDAFFGSWFWSDTRDAMVLASEYLESRRTSMSNFQLATVARTLGIVVDDTKLHDANYDSELTREIYRIVTGRQIEI